MKSSGIFSTAFLVVALGATALARVQDQQGDQNKSEHRQRIEPSAGRQGQPGQRYPQRAASEQERSQPRGQQQATQEQQRGPQEARLSQDRQRELISEQQRRVIQYRQRLDDQQRGAERYQGELHRQHRMAEYRFQQQYQNRLRQQQAEFYRDRDYNNDPYYYTAPSYRYSRDGAYYETNEYGAQMLRSAVNNGYAEGLRAGEADRQDQWQGDYQQNYAYQDANYGYDGTYIDQKDYNYYFRQGFSRGYDDGYNLRYQYGQYSNGAYNIIGRVLSSILNLQPLR